MTPEISSFIWLGSMKMASIVLSEAADAEQAVEGPMEFMAMDQAEFSHAHREVAVAVDVTLIDQDAARAVHRFDGVRLFIDGREIHVVAVVIPVAGLFPEVTVEDHRGHDFVVIGFIMEFVKFKQVVAQDHSLGMEEREARAFFVEAEQVRAVCPVYDGRAFRLLPSSSGIHRVPISFQKRSRKYAGASCCVHRRAQ